MEGELNHMRSTKDSKKSSVAKNIVKIALIRYLFIENNAQKHFHEGVIEI